MWLEVDVRDHADPMAVAAEARAAGHTVVVRDEMMDRLADEDWTKTVEAMEADDAWLASMEDERSGRTAHHRSGTL